MFRLSSKPMKTPVVENDNSAERNEERNKSSETENMDIPALQDEKMASLKPSFSFLHTEPTYHNAVNVPEELQDPLDTSLHTVCSQESIVLADLLSKIDEKQASGSADKETLDFELSFHVSNMTRSDVHELEDKAGLRSQESQSEDTVPKEEVQSEGESTTDGKNSTQEKPTLNQTETSHSQAVGSKRWIIVVVAIFALLQGIDMFRGTLSSEAVGTVEVMDAKGTVTGGLTIENTTMVDDENVEVNVFVGTYAKEETIPPPQLNPLHATWQVLLVAFLARLALRKQGCGGTTDERSDDDDVRPNVDPVKEEVVLGFDLAAYEHLKYDELRSHLRAKKCSSQGKKLKLIRRLAAVYHAELQTLTVVELRQRMKSKGMKQAGRKNELIQKLVETGF